MKKILLSFLFMFFACLSTEASVITVNSGYVSLDSEDSINMDNFWERNGKYEEKVLSIANKIIKANKLRHRMIFFLSRDKVINASADRFFRQIIIHQGLLPYIDNDDELAFIISHEISHLLDSYEESDSWVTYSFYGRYYELKSDLRAITLMEKAGYNPLAAITVMNKILDESPCLIDIFKVHPKGSTRMIAVYKYIIYRYPQYLNSPMSNNIYYVNFKTACEDDIVKFEKRLAQIKEQRILQAEKQKQKQLEKTKKTFDKKL